MRLALITILVTIVACTTPIEETLLQCDDCPEVRVSRVIDGDTLETPSRRVRLFGVDTPEAGERCASEATSRINELARNSVRLEEGPRLTDQFGRRLAYVYTEEGYNIDEILVREGLGTAWTEDGQHLDYLVELEQTTSRMGFGCLWLNQPGKTS
ncbi:MAG: thermonuclease family protein [Chloroflexota bacterium]|uniref:TNase-like domain-containing protein n=1 Tax=marine metagenome TaxID=408172 RepID=A0A381PVK7_9ZZZZ|nr:thermonuclease family protein [Chloroflexota bacterium]